MSAYHEKGKQFSCEDGKVVFKHKDVGFYRFLGNGETRAEATLGRHRLIAIGDDPEICSTMLQRSYAGLQTDE